MVKKIDLHSLIKEKLGWSLPKFLVWPLKKLIHQDELNKFLDHNENKVGLDFVNASLTFLDIKIKIIGAEKLICDNQRYCFISNHPLGGVDGLILLKIIGERYDNVKIFINSFLSEIPGLEPLSVPINVIGKNSKEKISNIIDIFQSDNQIIMFPAGLCSRKQNGVVKDLPWKKAFVQESIKYDRTIVPIYFHGSNSRLFYSFAKLSNFFGLSKLPMILLPNEMWKSRGKEFTVVIGRPVTYQQLKELNQSSKELADNFFNVVYYELPKSL